MDATIDKKKTIQDLIKETDCDAIRAEFTDAPYPAYDYQCVVYDLTAKEIRRADPEPGVIVAAVSAGKTTMISMATRRIQNVNLKRRMAGLPVIHALVLARQAEIVQQDAEEMWGYKVQNSIYCAGLSAKAVAYPVVVGSEGTVVNALHKRMSDDRFCPMFLFIDECHQVSVNDYCESEYRKFRDEFTGEERTGETWDEMIASKRSQYTLIIRELERRCLAKHGKRLRIIGYTGSPYRDNQLIINEDVSKPGLWRRKIVDIDTEYLVEFGAVVPTRFGDTAKLRYELDEFNSAGGEGDKDFTESEIRAMQDQISSQGTLTQKIMLEVQERCKSRLNVLVTCAGKKHCQEAADALLPGTTYVIITDDMPQKKRIAVMEEIKAGKYKYTFQIGCLTTGVNVPLWDTNVILRRIGSITLLIQLIGRTMRLLRKAHIEAGYQKDHALVLDYSGTMDDLGKVYFDPIIDQYMFQMAEINDDFITCPVCEEAGRDGRNSPFARRCIHHDENGVRCEHFFKFRLCEDHKDPRTGKVLKVGCQVKNDVAARFCRNCGGMLIDPNKKLSSKHYKEGDFYNVLDFSLRLTNDQKAFYFEYTLEKPEGGSFKAREILMPEKKETWIRNRYKAVVSDHLTPKDRKEVLGVFNAIKVMGMAHLFMAPLRVSYRKVGDGKGKDTIAHKVFVEDDF